MGEDINIKELLYKFRNDEDKFKQVYIYECGNYTDFDHMAADILATVFWHHKDTIIKHLLRKEKLKNILDK